MNCTTPPTWAQLLKDATTQPGVVAEAYRAFHNYSSGNQMLAYEQCALRNILIGPIATFPGWKAKGRHVKRGEHAIVLCMPVTARRSETIALDDEGNELVEEHVFTRYVFKPHWFVLSQTDGLDVEPEPVPGWSHQKAAQGLGIAVVPFTSTNGNCQGYASQLGIAVSPVAARPLKTFVHELAHVVLGHLTDAALEDGEQLTRSTVEMEAESVAMLVLASLELPGVEESRGYVQSWYGTGKEIAEKSATRIFGAADKILRAGRV